MLAATRPRLACGSLASPGMSPDFRKVALIAASLGLLVSLFFALRPDDDVEAAGTTTAATTTDRATTTERMTTTERHRGAAARAAGRPGADRRAGPTSRRP